MKRAIVALAALTLIVLINACGSVSESEESEELHRAKPAEWWRVKENASSVRVTSNPLAVQGCKFLANVRSEGHATRSTDDLQFKTARLGGNVVYCNNTRPGREIIGDAYRCDQGSSEIAQAPPPDPRIGLAAAAETSEALAGMKRSGVLVKFNPIEHRAEVNSELWKLLKPGQREQDAKILASFCGDPVGYEKLTIVDARSGAVVGRLAPPEPRR